MAVIVLTSAPGAPGVTTTALALALTWPRHVLLADCDRDPSQVVLAGYLRGMDSGGRGLPSVAQAQREGRRLDDELWLHTLPLTEEEHVERRFLAGFAQPAAVRLFDTIWSRLGEAFDVLDSRGIDVLVDAGRIGTNGLPTGLLTSADAVLAVTRSSLRSLAALRLHLPTVRDQLGGLPVDVPLALGIVGPDQPYGTRDIEKQFGVPVWLELPLNAKAASVLTDGEPEPRRFGEQLFMGRTRAQAKRLSELVHSRRATDEELVGRV